MAYLLGWKDILRPIRDGYRHLFPSPDKGPTPEEREKQRQLDCLKGLTYSDTFDQLERWTEADSDPVQRANTPLLLRPTAPATNDEGRAKVLLCHDYAGNYQDYEAATSVGVDNLQYYCGYLQYVDAFVYFSHKLVCVPPPSWTNTLHRNGVKVFGTVLVEPQTKDSDRLLQSITKVGDESTKVEFPLVRKLADIAKHYGFDGWLINIEKPFTQGKWDLNLLRAFLGQLKAALGDTGELIWYDALNIDNKVAYQNALTPKNLPFTTACGAVLTNYCWSESDAVSSKDLALKHGLSPDKVYFGIDVWAQNKAKLTQPRTTFPQKGGGGTNTGVAVSKLAEIGLSAVIFAPGWSFEHFHDDRILSHKLAIEHAMWEGREFPGGPFQITCSCGDTNQRHPVNREHPITRCASHFPAGSERFFYTDFSMPFAHHSDEEGHRLYNGMKLHSQLGAQSILPHPSTGTIKGSKGHDADFLTHHIQIDDNKAYLRVTADGRDISEATEYHHLCTYEQHLSLFKLDMPADGSLQLSLSCLNHLHGSVDDVTSIYLYCTDGIRYIRLQDTTPTGEAQTINNPINAIKKTAKDVRLQELGVHVRTGAIFEEPTHVLDIYAIRIVPQDHIDLSWQYSIHGTMIKKRGEGDAKHWRLRWTYLNDRGEDNSCALGLPQVPHSDTTGPFSHFLIQMDDMELGRAYALEYVLPKSFIEGLSGQIVKVALIGMGFDGREIARYEQDMEIPP